MGEKRRRNNGGDKGEDGETSTSIDTKRENQNMKESLLPSSIKNKEKRSAVHAKLKREKKLEKRKKAKAREAAEKRALELGEEVWPCHFPQIISFA